MNNGKAGGHDGIVIENVKFLGDKSLSVIVDLYNRILETERYPSHFKFGIVITLFVEQRTDLM